MECREQLDLFVEIGGAGLGSWGLARGMPSNGNRGPGQPEHGRSPRGADPEIPVDNISIRRIKAAKLLESLLSEGDGRAAERVFDGQDWEEAAGCENGVSGSEPAAF